VHDALTVNFACAALPHFEFLILHFALSIAIAIWCDRVWMKVENSKFKIQNGECWSRISNFEFLILNFELSNAIAIQTMVRSPL
jgi:hypothetical protein